MSGLLWFLEPQAGKWHLTAAHTFCQAQDLLILQASPISAPSSWQQLSWFFTPEEGHWLSWKTRDRILQVDRKSWMFYFSSSMVPIQLWKTLVFHAAHLPRLQTWFYFDTDHENGSATFLQLILFFSMQIELSFSSSGMAIFCLPFDHIVQNCFITANWLIFFLFLNNLKHFANLFVSMRSFNKIDMSLKVSSIILIELE